MRMKKFVILMLTAALVLCGCGSAPAETTPTTQAPETTQPSTAAPTEEPTEVTTQPTEAPPVDVNPLTGEALEEVSDRRIIGVMLNNHDLALPQCGVGQADILYEVLAEGDVTRFMALFSDTTDAGPIGPVRSLRPYYLNIMRGYDALCTSAGGSDEADGMIYSLGYDRMNGINGSSANYFYRDAQRRESRGYEHALFINGQTLHDGAGELGMRITRQEDADFGLTFTQEPLTDGAQAQKITLWFRTNGKTSTLTYDAQADCYHLFQKGQDFVDGNTGEKVPFQNVLVLYSESYVLDGKGHLSVQTTGQGTGYYARDSKMIPITWSRENEDSPFTYTDESGNPVTFGVGKTYAAFLPVGSPVEFQ